MFTTNATSYENKNYIKKLSSLQGMEIFNFILKLLIVIWDSKEKVLSTKLLIACDYMTRDLEHK